RNVTGVQTCALPISSRTPSHARSVQSDDDHSPFRSDEEKRYASEDEQDGGSRSEIQSIMEQFSEAGGGPGEEEVMSPRLEITSRSEERRVGKGREER